MKHLMMRRMLVLPMAAAMLATGCQNQYAFGSSAYWNKVVTGRSAPTPPPPDAGAPKVEKETP